MIKSCNTCKHYRRHWLSFIVRRFTGDNFDQCMIPVHYKNLPAHMSNIPYRFCVMERDPNWEFMKNQIDICGVDGHHWEAINKPPKYIEGLRNLMKRNNK